MTPTLTALKSLEERLAKATGPDMYTDSEIAAEIAGFARCHIASCGERGTVHNAPPYTASKDSCFALLDAALPDYEWMMARGRTRHDEPLYGFQIFPPGSGRMIQMPSPVAEAESNDLLSALCLAIIRARIAQEEMK